MGVKLDEIKKKNIDKIRLGACIELLILLDNFNSNFSRLQDFISENSNLLNNQPECTIKKQFDDLMEVITNDIDILLNDIDKNENYCNYMGRFY